MDTEISDSLDLGGYNVDDIQDEIAISNAGAVSGTSKYISDYSSSFSDGEDVGNYLAIHADVTAPLGATYSIDVTSGDNQVVAFGKVFVVHVTDKSSQTVEVVASATGYASVTKTLSLTGLTCLDS